jgi:PAS domain S-box-containing protein
MAETIERLLQMDAQDTARDRERMAFRARMAAVIEALPEALVVGNPNGQIVLVNARTEFMFGYHRSELLGRQVEFLMPERFRCNHVVRRRAYDRSDAGRQARAMGCGARLIGMRKDGHEFGIEITLSRTIERSGCLSIALIRHARPLDLCSMADIPPALEIETSDA